MDFNPRSPHGERRLAGVKICRGSADFNPRSPHGERRADNRRREEGKEISIHAPRTGSDKGGGKLIVIDGGFQSTLPARGATQACQRGIMRLVKFQSTLPARGATDVSELTGGSLTFQSTLPARGATDALTGNIIRERFQSTLPARGATKGYIFSGWQGKFQSTLPARGATSPIASQMLLKLDFNPRSPHGERRKNRNAAR